MQPKPTHTMTSNIIPDTKKKDSSPSSSDKYEESFDIVESIANLGDQFDESNKNKEKVGGFDEANLDQMFNNNKKDKK